MTFDIPTTLDAQAGMTRTAEEHSPELIAEIFRSRHVADRDCCVAILNEQSGAFVQRGTGTLLRIGGHSFLVTASHVIVRGENDSESLKLFVVGKSLVPVPLRGKFVASHKEGMVDSDPADIAVIHLSKNTIEQLGESVFLRQTDIVVGEDLKDDYYFFTGYPTEWSNPSAEKQPGLSLLTYCTQLYTGSTSSFGGYRQDWHVLLRRGGALRVTLQPTDMPSQLNGISGCSIWRSFFATSGGEGGARVVAVQTGAFRKQSVLKATKWALVWKMIATFYPDLKPSLSLSLPR